MASDLFSVNVGAAHAGLEDFRVQGHLEKGIWAEADGLFAGFVFLDETESPIIGADGPRDDLSRELQALFNEVPFNEAAGAQSSNIHNGARARIIAWPSLRTVHYGMEVLWNHFVDVAATLDNAAINNILVDYQDAKGLRRTGAIAFRNMVTGLVPNDLCKIFALCSLSYVVSCLLHARNRLAEVDILAGVRLWIKALWKEDERDALELLAERLWPQARNHLHFYVGERYQRQATSQWRGAAPSPVLPTYTQPASSIFINTGFISQPSSGYNLQGNIPYNEDNTSGYRTSHVQYEGMDASLLNLQQVRHSIPMYAQDPTESTHDEWNFSLVPFGPPESYLGPAPSYQHDTDPGASYSVRFETSSTVEHESAVPWATEQSPVTYDSRGQLLNNQPQSISSSITARESNRLSQLQETSMFGAVVQFIHENEYFWYELAGRGLASKDFLSCLAWYQERLPRKIHIQNSFIQPLSLQKNERDPVSRGIVAIAEAFFEQGLLQERKYIERYMVRAGSVSAMRETYN